MRTGLTLLLVVHGLIHLMGVAKGFGLAELPQLTTPISRPMAVMWLVASLLLLGSAFTWPRTFWLVGSLAIVASQFVICSAWTDAKYGTVVNVLLLLAAAYAFASQGPFSPARAFEAAARQTLASAQPLGAAVVSEADLTPLPAPVQRYLRVTGSVGKPRVVTYRVHWHGRIRGGASEPWMPFTAEQVSTSAPEYTRLFFMRATMKGLPVDVFHRYLDAAATFQVRVLSTVPVVDARGPEMNRSETVTILNDMCLVAPSMLLDPRLRWQGIDENAARVTFTRGAQTVTAELHFNAAGELVDFISDDRSQSSPDGKSFTRLRWSTPFTQYQSITGLHLFAQGEARWHPPQGAFAYGEFYLDRLEVNVSSLGE